MDCRIGAYKWPSGENEETAHILRGETTMLRNWEDLPDFMRLDEVRPYWEILYRKRYQLVLKRIFDVVMAAILAVLLFIPMIVIAIMVKAESRGPIFYRQERITTYGRKFKIHKFRTMVNNADKKGELLTVDNDPRLTELGKKLRIYRLDEIPQLIDILAGNMSFVGTRPEVAKYVKQYQPEFYATLLMPAGLTSEASIRYKDEYKLLNDADDVDKVYVEQVLPAKMKWNLQSITRFRFLREILTCIRTILAMCGKTYH